MDLDTAVATKFPVHRICACTKVANDTVLTALVIKQDLFSTVTNLDSLRLQTHIVLVHVGLIGTLIRPFI